ncbi:hypothetical protein BT96DRAFT_980245 [Gymnopus androsaceus JB14]|uniref:Uncharacterized protein n=1 Tax=Gymnopus androsaceus JB14 TaxID=1447944 RepID=A0A6A4GX75_9AGAR|nr:hypothetical protein BT96DRAFT_980245 [Gymnopus androsaceus JB14]
MAGPSKPPGAAVTEKDSDNSVVSSVRERGGSVRASRIEGLKDFVSELVKELVAIAAPEKEQGSSVYRSPNIYSIHGRPKEGHRGSIDRPQRDSIENRLTRSQWVVSRGFPGDCLDETIEFATNSTELGIAIILIRPADSSTKRLCDIPLLLHKLSYFTL